MLRELHRNAPVNVLHVASSVDPRDGGTSAAVVGMAKAQAKAGLDVRVCSMAEPGGDLRFANELRANGVAVSIIGRARTPTGLRKLWHVLNGLVAQAQVVHIHALWEVIQLVASKLASRHGMPYVLSPHGMLDPWSMSQKRLKKLAYYRLFAGPMIRSATALHFATLEEQRLATPWTAATPGIVEPFGVEHTEFTRRLDSGSLSQIHPSLSGRRKILFLSRLHHKKGLDLLIPAFAEACRAEGDIMLVLVGPVSDGYAATIETLIHQSELEDRIVLVGMLTGVMKLAAYRDADLFVLPSYQENFGLVVIEALACGLPVIITEHVNLARDIEGFGVGEVVPASVEGLSKAIAKWMRCSALRQAAAEAGPQLVSERYTWDIIGPHWREHYSMIRRRNVN
jgi:glycosyltransferase involved in cell wall biosynthesis